MNDGNPGQPGAGPFLIGFDELRLILKHVVARSGGVGPLRMREEAALSEANEIHQGRIACFAAA